MPLPRHPRRISKHGVGRACGLVVLAGLLLEPGVFAQAPAPASVAPKPVFEEWVLLVLDGKRCGYGMTQVTAVDTPSGPGYLTLNHQEFLVKRLGVSLDTGVNRASLVHYNTLDEIHAFGKVLLDMVRGR